MPTPGRRPGLAREVVPHLAVTPLKHLRRDLGHREHQVVALLEHLHQVRHDGALASARAAGDHDPVHTPTRPQLVLELRQRLLQLSDATRAIGVVNHPPK